MKHTLIIEHTKAWLEHFIIAENLCPFAHKEFARETIRYAVLESCDDNEIYDHVVAELNYLDLHEDVQTTLLIWPALESFERFLSFVGMAEMVIRSHGLEAKYQLAHFHPQYVFAGVGKEAAENYTNRAPYPILHLLRVEEMAKALERYKNPEMIPENNIKRMNEIGNAELQAKLLHWQGKED